MDCGKRIKQANALHQCLMRNASPAMEYPDRKRRSYVIDHWRTIYVNQTAICSGFRNYSGVEHSLRRFPIPISPSPVIGRLGLVNE